MKHRISASLPFAAVVLAMLPAVLDQTMLATALPVVAGGVQAVLLVAAPVAALALAAVLLLRERAAGRPA